MEIRTYLRTYARTSSGPCVCTCPYLVLRVAPKARHPTVDMNICRVASPEIVRGVPQKTAEGEEVLRVLGPPCVRHAVQAGRPSRRGVSHDTGYEVLPEHGTRGARSTGGSKPQHLEPKATERDLATPPPSCSGPPHGPDKPTIFKDVRKPARGQRTNQRFVRKPARGKRTNQRFVSKPERCQRPNQ